MPNPLKIKHAFRVHVNTFGSVQMDPVEVLDYSEAAQTAEVILACGWRPRSVPFAELASTPERAAALAVCLLSSPVSAQKSALFPMAGAETRGAFSQ